MIEVRHLTKRYGVHTAVSDLNFTIEDGKIYGFLGPNGAGKSTTMNILTGCLAPTEGEILISGYDILEEPVKAKRKIGYLPEIPPVYPERTVREYLRFVAEAKGVAKADVNAEIARVISLTGIEAYENRLIRHMSKGYRQRVGIAQALVGDPEIIILDEPTVGLDPQQIVEIRDLIASLRHGHTVILSSHILSEIQAVSDMVIIIHQGKIVAIDTPEHLERAFKSNVSVEAVIDCTKEEAETIVLEAFGSGAECTAEDCGGATKTVIRSSNFSEKEIASKLFFAAADRKKPILSLAAKRLSLEEVFLSLTADGGENEKPRPEGKEEGPSEAGTKTADPGKEAET